MRMLIFSRVGVLLSACAVSESGSVSIDTLSVLNGYLSLTCTSTAASFQRNRSHTGSTSCQQDYKWIHPEGTMDS